MTGLSSEASQQSQIHALSDVFYGVRSQSSPCYFKIKKFATILCVFSYLINILILLVCLFFKILISPTPLSFH